MEEQRIILLGIFDQPLHVLDNVGLDRSERRVLVIISEQNNVVVRVVESVFPLATQDGV